MGVVFGVPIGFAVEKVAGEGRDGVVDARSDVGVPRHGGILAYSVDCVDGNRACVIEDAARASLWQKVGKTTVEAVLQVSSCFVVRRRRLRTSA